MRQEDAGGDAGVVGGMQRMLRGCRGCWGGCRGHAEDAGGMQGTC